MSQRRSKRIASSRTIKAEDDAGQHVVEQVVVKAEPEQDVELTVKRGKRGRGKKRQAPVEENAKTEGEVGAAKTTKVKSGQDAKPPTSSDAKETPKRRKIKSDSPPVLDAPDLHAFAGRTHWVGAHMSIADGVENSIASARRYACEGFALFLKAKMNWTYKPLAQDNIDRFRRWLPALGYTGERCLPHGSYLINLGNPNNAKRAQAMDSFLDDLRRCALLGISVYNFHPGSGVGDCTKEQACTNIATCINEAHVTLANENLSCPIILLENMAGQGQQVGRYFEELADVIAQVRDQGKVGVCLDTAHAFAAGIDIRTIAGFNAMMADFDRIIGAQYLHGMHLNDSKEALGSRKDRHENIGQGHIGLAPFWCIMNQGRFARMPLVLETPAASWRVWKGEIEALYELQGLPEEEGAWQAVKEKLKALSELPKEMAGTDIAKAGKDAQRAAEGLPPKPYKEKRTKGEGDKKGATGKTAQAKVKKATAVKKEILKGQALQHATDELAIDRPAADGGLAPKRKRKAL